MRKKLYNQAMHAVDRDFRWALVGVSGISILGYFIHSFTPDTPLLISLFFAIIAMTTFGWMFFIIPVKRVAILTTIFVFLFLFLRLINLRHPLYVVLLAVFFISLEVIRHKR